MRSNIHKRLIKCSLLSESDLPLLLLEAFHTALLPSHIVDNKRLLDLYQARSLYVRKLLKCPRPLQLLYSKLFLGKFRSLEEEILRTYQGVEGDLEVLTQLVPTAVLAGGSKVLTNLVAKLIQNPQLLAVCRQSDMAIRQFIFECVRLYPPSTRGVPRKTYFLLRAICSP